MHTFTVWAPDASAVSLVLRSETQKMAEADDGWWKLEVPEAGHGTDYAFSVDGSEPMPDPRSPWQPDGVHGFSRVFDTSLHDWSDGDWAGRDARGSVFYELHIGTFTPEGTLEAAAGHLDYLVALGVEMVSLMPVAAFPGRHGWGYDGVDLYAVHESYGGPEALQRFVDQCHSVGLAVCLDVVYNHLGPSGNYLGSFGPYFTSRHTTPWGPAVNLDDTGSFEVRRWICDNALRWFREFHLDALRLDAVHALADDSPKHLLAQLSEETAALSASLGRPLGLVAESDLNDPRTVEPVAEGGLGMTAQWSDDFHHALHTLLTGERAGYYVDFGEPAVFAKTLREVFLHDGSYSTFRGKDWGRPVDPGRHRGGEFLVYTSNHDQVGNRALGDRPHLTPASWRSAPRWCSPRRTRRCCSWARSGALPRPGGTSRITTSPNWPRPSGPAVVVSSRHTGGTPRTSPTRRTRRPGRARCWTGPSWTSRRIANCSPGTAICWRCGPGARTCGTIVWGRQRSRTTRTDRGW